MLWWQPSCWKKHEQSRPAKPEGEVGSADSSNPHCWRLGGWAQLHNHGDHGVNWVGCVLCWLWRWSCDVTSSPYHKIRVPTTTAKSISQWVRCGCMLVSWGKSSKNNMDTSVPAVFQFRYYAYTPFMRLLVEKHKCQKQKRQTSASETCVDAFL